MVGGNEARRAAPRQKEAIELNNTRTPPCSKILQSLCSFRMTGGEKVQDGVIIVRRGGVGLNQLDIFHKRTIIVSTCKN